MPDVIHVQRAHPVASVADDGSSGKVRITLDTDDGNTVIIFDIDPRQVRRFFRELAHCETVLNRAHGHR